MAQADNLFGVDTDNLPGISMPGKTQISIGGQTRPISEDELKTFLNLMGVSSVNELTAPLQDEINKASAKRQMLSDAMPATMDLSPLYALGKAETGKDLSGGYNKPPSAVQSAQMLLSGDDMVNKLREATASTKVKALGDILQAKYSQPSLSKTEQQPMPQQGAKGALTDFQKWEIAQKPQNDVNKFAEGLVRNGADYPAMLTQLKNAQRILGNFDPNNSAAVPGLGEWGQGMLERNLPNIAGLNPNHVQAQQNYLGLKDILVQLRHALTGAQFGAKEAAEYAQLLGMAESSDPATMRMGLRLMTQKLASTLKSKYAGLPVEANKLAQGNADLPHPKDFESLLSGAEPPAAMGNPVVVPKSNGPKASDVFKQYLKR